jgi:outer membrane receptor protein involved in Fe transport
VRLTAGLRYDDMRFEFENGFSPGAVQVGTSFYGQAADTKVSFRGATPKIGATYALGDNTHVFASYNQGFRAPSESQLFRPSRAGKVALSGVVSEETDRASLGLIGN